MLDAHRQGSFWLPGGHPVSSFPFLTISFLRTFFRAKRRRRDRRHTQEWVSITLFLFLFFSGRTTFQISSSFRMPLTLLAGWSSPLYLLLRMTSALDSVFVWFVIKIARWIEDQSCIYSQINFWKSPLILQVSLWSNVFRRAVWEEKPQRKEGTIGKWIREEDGERMVRKMKRKWKEIEDPLSRLQLKS